MKRSRNFLLHCLPPLVVSLVIYMLFRSPDTIVNQVFSRLLGFRPPVLRLAHGQWLVYNLPGALWLYSFLWFSSLSRSKLLSLLPLGMALGIELVQLLHITDGTFDLLDVVFYLCALLAFVALGDLRWPTEDPAIPRHSRLSRRYKFAFVSFMVIVVLSDVWVK
jgi:hypothetical protein